MQFTQKPSFKPFTIRLEEDLADRVRAVAKEHNVTVTEVIKQFVTKGLTEVHKDYFSY